MARGYLSPVELARCLLQRIDTLDKALKAWVTVDHEDMLEVARQREKELRDGRPRGLLHGVPVGLKDIFYTKGMKTTAGSRLYADFVPSYDATCVARIKAAGGIILGKTVTTELAFADPPPTLNPWNPAHTPGGSSSGSSVAVATRMCAAALGSQTGGSTCRPAAYNGIVGLKPTYGRISRYGMVPLSGSLDTVGILVRTVEDAAILLQVMSAHDPNDPGSSSQPVPDFLAEMRAQDRPPHIGLIEGFFRDHSSDAVWAHTREVVERLARAGAVVASLPLPPSFDTAHSCAQIIMSVECAAYHQEMFRDRSDEYGPAIRSAIELGMSIPGVDYVTAQRRRRQFQQELAQMLDRVDVALTPATPAQAPRDLTTTGDAGFQIPWSCGGLPTVVIPSGLSHDGLPFGIQLAARPFQEGKLLAAARWCEMVLGVQLAPPGYA